MRMILREALWLAIAGVGTGAGVTLLLATHDRDRGAEPRAVDFRHAADAYLVALGPLYGQVQAIDRPQSLYYLRSNFVPGGLLEFTYDAENREPSEV